MKWLDFATGKSGKREVAVSLLLMWAFASAYLFYWVKPDTIEKYKEIWTTLTWAVLAWAAAAFGIDFVIKNGMGGAPRYQQPPQTPKQIDKGIEGPL